MCWNCASKSSTVTTFECRLAPLRELELHFKIKHSYNDTQQVLFASAVGITLQNQAWLQRDLNPTCITLG